MSGMRLNKAEARPIAEQVLAEWRLRPYSELVAWIDKPHHADMRGASGTLYQVVVNVFYDTGPTKRNPLPPVRIFVNIDNGGLSAFLPLSVTDVVPPDPHRSNAAQETPGTAGSIRAA